MEDLTNQIIGNIKIICRDYDYGKNKGLKEWNKKTFWTCECLLCGNIFTRQGSIIKELGDNNKCNTCSKSKITFNKKYGMLTVLKRDNDYVKNHKIKNTRQKYYLCQCDCGNYVSVCGKHLKNGNTISCGCISRSLGEQKIEEILQKNSIYYKREYVLKELNNKRFDFVILDKLTNKIIRIIEFDGRQHYFPVDVFGGEENFRKRKESDNEKNEWAIKNNIPLLRIPYWERDNISYDMLFKSDTYLINNKTLNDHSLKCE